jgi:Pentapeptide repeats (8 copies)
MAYNPEQNFSIATPDGAHLSWANLSRADLSRADLYGANLSGANLYGADLSRADLYGANHVIALGQPDGWWAFAYLWENEIWVRVGCRTMSITEGRTYWADKKDRREVLAALDFAETIARLRGWELGK